PLEIQDPALVTSELAPYFDIDEEKMFKMLSKSDDPYELFTRKASDEQVAKVKELSFDGIYISEDKYRFYPFRELASQIIGFTAPTDNNYIPTGRYGLELYYNEELSGKMGSINGDNITEAVAGEDLYLTIDSNIQTQAEEVLNKLVDKYSADRGMVIVQNPKTGAILAMGATPGFDPNNYGEYRLANFLNPAIETVYEPGSVMKIITMSAGLDAGKLTPNTTYYDSGELKLDGFTIKNWDKKAHGRTTMTEVIEGSLNTGAAYAQSLIGKDLFYNYLTRFGFGETTGIALPGEVGGSLRNLEGDSRDVNFATASFGQGVSVTPIQLINAVSSIANGGVLMRPYLLADKEPEVMRRVVSEKAAKQATDMLVSAVSKATVAAIPKFDVAGKTGTAQIPIKGGYAEDKFIHTFVGFAPAYDPEFTILIRIDNPYGAPLAGLTVVPSFRDLAEFLLNYYNVPPDHLE
ncbi:penicillin-binding protein 2, partial [Candidatus Wolfebacteria bacterium]|nr:penicillin-binding protein 2 [Candidatus Wolfebacteria bacterium]